MGQTLKKLAGKEISEKSVFNNRLVVEVCEKMHVHYRNLRISLSRGDFMEFARGMIAAFQRWQQRGSPEAKPGQHIELCRKKVAMDPVNDNVQINLNRNLYNFNKDKIFSEGADIRDQYYIHLKIRDLRIELSIDDYEVVSSAFKEADRKLKNSDTATLLQENRIYETVRPRS